MLTILNLIPTELEEGVNIREEGEKGHVKVNRKIQARETSVRQKRR